MAIQCQYCGTDLPRDDARFCNNCGMLVPSHPFSPQSISAAKVDAAQSSTPSHTWEEHKPVVREQIAQLPPVRPPRLLTRNAPSSWHGQYNLLEQGEQEKKGPTYTATAEPQGKLPETPQPETDEDEVEEPVQRERPPTPVQPRHLPNVARVRDGARGRTAKQAEEPLRSPTWPTPMTHVSINEPAEEIAPPEQQGPSSANVRSSGRELPASIWEPEEEKVPENEQADEVMQDIEDLPTRTIESLPANPAHAREQAVDLLPTSPLDLGEIKHSQGHPDEEPPTSSLPQQSPEQADASPYDVEYQSTTPLSTPRSAPSQPGNTTLPEHVTYIANHQSEGVQGMPAPQTPLPLQGPADGAVRNDGGQVPAVRSHVQRHPPILIVALLLLVLIIGGAGTWIVVAQPFSVAPITQPQLSFRNAQLGIALSYPNGWTQRVTPGVAHFYTDNHTAEVDINVANASDVNQALQQQATKLGLSGTKAGATLTFAGTTWQQLQGSLQQSGANYTVTLLAAVHGSHLYTIVQQAPQSNYADWEQSFFSPLRGSLQFL